MLHAPSPPSSPILPSPHVVKVLVVIFSGPCDIAVQQLDAEVASWRAHVFSEATKSTYSSHLRAFLRFCAEFSLTPCPAPTSTLLRYAAFLARSKCYTSVTQYLNIIRIIHQEFGYDNPVKDNWQLSSLLRGIKRGKGVTVNPKAPLMPKHLSQIRDMLRLDRLADLQFWAATLCAFFGLLRIGNLTPPHSVTRQDLSVTKKGIILYIRRSKTIQFGERTHSVVLPYLPGSHLCPVSTLLRFLGRTTSCPFDAPLFSIMDTAGRMVPLSAGAFRQRLQRVTSSCPLIPQCSMHSLRKGGATWLLSCNVPLATVRIIGDWSSDAVFRYLLPDESAKFRVLYGAAKLS